MKVIADKVTLVLVGAFNPAILTPEWIARNGLGLEPGVDFQVEMLAPLGVAAPARYSFNGISYSATLRNVTFYLDPNAIQAGEQTLTAAANILQQLPHTPIAGLGFNFAFLVEQPTESLLSLLTTKDDLVAAMSTDIADAEVVTRRWGNSLRWSEALVNIDCELAGGQATIRFNFHYSTESAVEAGRILRIENAFARHISQAITAATAISNQALEG